jgi:predicted NBD/HSP70 family sugar kinase
MLQPELTAADLRTRQAGWESAPGNSAPAPTSPLNETERAMLAQIMGARSTTRAEIAERLRLSKATISAGMKRLLGAGLVTEQGLTQGGLGRPAGVYRVAESAGCCMAIDLGTTRPRVQVVALDGRVLADSQAKVRLSKQVVSRSGIAATLALIEQTRGVLDSWGMRLRECVIAVPIKLSLDNPEPAELAPIFAAIRTLPAFPDFASTVENNVNCAAVAEGAHGAAQGTATYAYLQVGVKVGLGIVQDGILLRGRGGAGEVGALPFPWGPGMKPTEYALEDHLGSAGLLARAKERPDISMPPRTDVAALFARAAQGESGPRQLVADHAREVGQVASAIVAVLDPGLIVLGGGVGQSPLLLRGVRQEVRRLVWETEICNGQLGGDATIIGATCLVTESARRTMLASAY